MGRIKNHLWERALLYKGDYLPWKGRNCSFCVENDRDIGWKRLLREKDKRSYVKQLLDEITIEKLESTLKKIINSSNISDWRKYFIQRDGLIEECGRNKFIRYNENEDGNDILPLSVRYFLKSCIFQKIDVERKK